MLQLTQSHNHLLSLHTNSTVQSTERMRFHTQPAITLSQWPSQQGHNSSSKECKTFCPLDIHPLIPHPNHDTVNSTQQAITGASVPKHLWVDILIICLNSQSMSAYICRFCPNLSSVPVRSGQRWNLNSVPNYRILYGRYAANIYSYYYQYTITHALFHSRLKTFHFCKSFPMQPSLSLSGLTPRILRTVYRYFWAYPFFYFFCFPLFSRRFRAVDWADSCRLLSARYNSISYRIVITKP